MKLYGLRYLSNRGDVQVELPLKVTEPGGVVVGVEFLPLKSGVDSGSHVLEHKA